MTNEELAKIIKQLETFADKGEDVFIEIAQVKCLLVLLKELAIYRLNESGKSSDRPKGKWMLSDVQYGSTSFRCSACNDVTDDVPTCCNKPLFNFCPACGADMRGGGRQ